MAGQRPRQGWIYFINSYRVSLSCKLGHVHIYNLDEPGEVECQSCSKNINSSRVLRGTHPYIIWTSDKFQDESGYIATFSVIPLTSQTTFNGLPTTYPVNPTSRNSLTKKSYALVHQIYTVDANCFKDVSGNWLNRIGQLEKSDKNAIEEGLKYYLNIQDNPSEDWFAQNASPELLKKVFDYLDEDTKNLTIEKLINSLDS
ncbi:type II toxin-antitoxin system PemK/MazF family toxin [Nodularia harveyana UHCC-0300]|uniref:Type II toxin-antitoxin system PemK/MazF family toxin n=1 Tax=Nodularia harveyana UHCC-0300 TaxID=2974287 RepID=A0ABU5UGT1_9CYAN|nr:type II toxin-antitoxin system PemK/MazF family toxin [Nodularia harveyana]MEA5582746.1 type II toxin-antitoxin system PemK/MazF family toxin [Nodularia harveyana UHCC-0300]